MLKLPKSIFRKPPVIHLEFKIFVYKVKALLECEHLEQDEGIDYLGPCIALAGLRVACFKEWTETFP